MTADNKLNFKEITDADTVHDFFFFFSFSLIFHSPDLQFPGPRSNLPKGHNLNWSRTGSQFPFHVAELKAIDIMFSLPFKLLLICAC